MHAVQREVTLYVPPPMGGDEIGLVVGISVLSGTVAVIVVIAFVVNGRCSSPVPMSRLSVADLVSAGASAHVVWSSVV